jgi:hypothetical protein
MPSRGLTYARLNENGVIFLFSKIAEDMGITIKALRSSFRTPLGNGTSGRARSLIGRKLLPSYSMSWDILTETLNLDGEKNQKNS